jgi:hypothetical protein
MKLKLFVFFLFTTSFLKAQSVENLNTTDLIFECTKYSGLLPSKQIAIWYPNDFWVIMGNQMKFPPETISKISNEMKNYLMFAIIDYTFTSTGKMIFKSEEDICKTILLTDSSKTSYYPLKSEEMSMGAKKIQEELKPVMEKMFGQLGEGMRILLFNAPNTDGKNILNIKQKGSFSLNWDSTNLKWKLPFNSVLSPKFCPIDKEEMKGSWFFCPEHGKKLK